MIWFLLFVFFGGYFVIKVRSFKKEKEWRDLTIFTFFSGAALFLIAASMMWNIPPLMKYLAGWTGSLSEQLTSSIFGISPGGGK